MCVIQMFTKSRIQLSSSESLLCRRVAWYVYSILHFLHYVNTFLKLFLNSGKSIKY